MTNKKEVKLIIYLEDNNQTKDRDAIILEQNQFGIKIQLWDSINNKELEVPAFFLPWTRILKIKDKEVSK